MVSIPCWLPTSPLNEPPNVPMFPERPEIRMPKSRAKLNTEVGPADMELAGSRLAVDEVRALEELGDLENWNDDEGEYADGEIGEPDAVRVSIRNTTQNGEDRADLFAHGDVGGEKKEVNLASVIGSALVMFPLYPSLRRSRFLESRYDPLEKITVIPEERWRVPTTVRGFDELLAELPSGFVRQARFGLGLKNPYRFLPLAVADFPGVTDLVITPGDALRVDGSRYFLGDRRFAQMKTSIDSINRRAMSRSLGDRRMLVVNELLHPVDPNMFPKQYQKVKPGEIYEMVKLGARQPQRNADDRRAAAMLLKDEAPAMARQEPNELLELKADIEVIALAELIAKIEDMLGKDLSEAKWQAFLKANPFVVALAFPYPVFLIQDQAHVGGTKINGIGENIGDFLVAQRFTGALALIEIKRPSTSLVEPKPYRGGDVHAPHRDLTAAAAQAMGQRVRLLTNFAVKALHDEALEGTHVSGVHCIVIAGMTPSTKAEKRSFDMFRNATKDVSIVTFDDLLEKLRQIHKLMGLRPAAQATIAVEESTGEAPQSGS